MIRLLSAQPATPYYVWQVEVMLNNFLEMGINLNWVDIVCCKENGVIPQQWSKLASNYAARFFFYNDTRETKHYISSIRPNILKQHFQAYPELSKETFLYHDCDIVFTKPINWQQFEEDDIWYGSNTEWYISYDYIISKGKDVFDKMVEVMDINPQLVIDNNKNSIGAQYILKNIDDTFWKEVERDCEELFRVVGEFGREKKKKDNTHHELQIWCADMWAVLWNGWKRGNQTKCHNELQFSWATSDEKEYYKCNIMHNAGVTNSTSGLFYKPQYQQILPYNVAVEPNKGTASWHYWNWIQKTAEKTCLI